jgi:hypothetical protein
MQPAGVQLQTNALFGGSRDGATRAEAAEARTPQAAFAWQGNPEFSGGPAGM